MSRLDHYIECYGDDAGPKLYHALQSRAAHIGTSRRRGREIEALTGRQLRDRTRRGPVRIDPAPLLSGLVFASLAGPSIE